MLAAIKNVFRDKYASKKVPIGSKRPYRNSQAQRAIHPDIRQLVADAQQGDHKVIDHLTESICRDHWQEFVASSKLTDISAANKIVAQLEGRKPRGDSFACASHPMSPRGWKIIAPEDKCEMLADYI